MLLHSRMRDARVGEVLHIVATDPSTERDIPKFCRFLGHDLLAQEQVGDEYHFLLRKQVDDEQGDA